MTISKNKAVLLGVAAGLIAGALGGTVVAGLRHGQVASAPPATAAVAGKTERKIVLYRSPMGSGETSSVPRKDGMGMDFVPVYDDEATGQSEVSGLAAVKIDAQRQQLIGLRTAEVTEGPISSDWRTVGRVAVDETRVRKINIKIDGFVEKLFVNYTGKLVRRGDPLFSLYSPDLLSAEQEYLLALRTRQQLGASPAGEDLVASARRRLELWDIPKAEIAALEQTGEPRRTMTLTSPIAGVVTAKNVVQGSRLTTGEMPFEITDLSEVWVLADAHESDLPRVKLGTPVTLTLEAMPGQAFAGKVSFIEPVLDPKTRTVKVRLAFANHHGDLRPEMFGEVVFHARPHKGLRVPADSIIDSGDRKVVFIALGDGRFEPREVKAGDMAGDLVEVTAGLSAGENVIVRASFLVDSESQFKAALAAVTAKSPPAGDKAAGKAPPVRHVHGAMP